jgi:hypothetical protein
MLFFSTSPEIIDAFISGIDELSYADRDVRWEYIDWAAQQYPGVKARLREIAAGSENDHFRFVAACHVAGFGRPTNCAVRDLIDIPAGYYITLFRRDERKIECDPAIKDLRITLPNDPEQKRNAQDTLWEVMQKYNLDFRIRSDGTFYVFRPVIEASTLPSVFRD